MIGRRTLAIAAAWLAVSSPAEAAVLLDVGGPADTGIVLDADMAGAISFTLDEAATNVEIYAPMSCFDCQGSIWLQRTAIGATASLSDVIDAKVFDGSTTEPYFTITSLDPGLYFLIAALDSDTDGFVVWTGSTLPEIAPSGATRGIDFLAEDTMPFVPSSDFGVIFGRNLSFTVTGDLASPVPEPATWLLILSSFGLTGAALRRRAGNGPSCRHQPGRASAARSAMVPTTCQVGRDFRFRPPA